MTNPNTLLDAIVDSLRGIPALIAGLGGDPARIWAYKHRAPKHVEWSQAMWTMRPPDTPGVSGPPGIMVRYRGTHNGRRGQTTRTVHDFSLYLMDSDLSDDVCTMYINLMEGAGPDGLQWPYSAIHDSVEMGDSDWPSLSARTIPISETASLDYHEVQFSLVEKLG